MITPDNKFPYCAPCDCEHPDCNKCIKEHDNNIIRDATLKEQERCIKILHDYKNSLDYPNCPPGDTISKLIKLIQEEKK